MENNLVKSVTYLDENDNTVSVEVPKLNELSWQLLSEWMNTTGVKDEGSAIRHYYCVKNGITLNYEYDLPEEERDPNQSFFSEWDKRVLRIEHAQKQEKERLVALLKSIRTEFIDNGVKRIDFEWAGAGDSMDYAEAQVILTDIANDEKNEEKRNRFFNHWNSMLDHLSNHIVSAFYSASFNNEGGGGRAHWFLELNSFEYSSYYNEMREMEDEEGCGQMEVA